MTTEDLRAEWPDWWPDYYSDALDWFLFLPPKTEELDDQWRNRTRMENALWVFEQAAALANELTALRQERDRLRPALEKLSAAFVALWWDDWRGCDEAEAAAKCDAPAYLEARAALEANR